MVSPAAVYAAAAFLAVAAAAISAGIPGAAEAAPSSFSFPQTQNRAESDGKSGETCPPAF